MILYTDGSCLQGRGKRGGAPGGVGYVALYDGLELHGSMGFFKTTNNRMEFLAIILPLEEIKVPSEIMVITDSQYVINASTLWANQWERNNWLKRDGSPVSNVDLVKRLKQLMRFHVIRFQWVRGHSGDYYNEICDKLALEGSINPTEVDVGFLGY